MLSNCDDIIRQHKAACLRITALLSCNDLLWIGTSAGVLLTLPVANSTKGLQYIVPSVTGIPHGHTGHVRFLTCVELSNPLPSNNGSSSGSTRTAATVTASESFKYGGRMASHEAVPLKRHSSSNSNTSNLTNSSCQTTTSTNSSQSNMTSTSSSGTLTSQAAATAATNALAGGGQRPKSASVLIISGGDGYEDFRSSTAANSANEVAGREDSTNHLLLWQT